MPTDDRDELEDSLRTIHIEELKRKARELSNGEMIMHESEDIPADIAEQFWEQVVAFEEGPFTTHSKQLAQDGVELPPPDELDDQQLSKKLWELLDRLAARHVFVTSTNHLSDRDLPRGALNGPLARGNLAGADHRGSDLLCFRHGRYRAAFL